MQTTARLFEDGVLQSIRLPPQMIGNSWSRPRVRPMPISGRYQNIGFCWLLQYSVLLWWSDAPLLRVDIFTWERALLFLALGNLIFVPIALRAQPNPGALLSSFSAPSIQGGVSMTFCTLVLPTSAQP